MVIEYSARHLALIEWRRVEDFHYSCSGALFRPFGIARAARTGADIIVAMAVLVGPSSSSWFRVALIETVVREAPASSEAPDSWVPRSVAVLAMLVILLLGSSDGVHAVWGRSSTCLSGVLLLRFADARATTRVTLIDLLAGRGSRWLLDGDRRYATHQPHRYGRPEWKLTLQVGPPVACCLDDPASSSCAGTSRASSTFEPRC